MIKEEDIKKIATLSRIAVSDEEIHSLKEDIEGILSYVEQVASITEDVELDIGEVRNVMREDGEPHEGGIFTEALLSQVAESKDGYVKVRKIIDQG